MNLDWWKGRYFWNKHPGEALRKSLEFSRTPWKVLSQRSQPAASSKPQSARGSPPQCTNGWITPNPFALMPTIAVVSPEWLGNHGKRLCGAPRADVSSAVGRADRATEQVR